MSRSGRPERTKTAILNAIAAVDEAITAGVIIYPEDGAETKRRSRSILFTFKDNLQAMLEDVLSWEQDPKTQHEWTPPLGHIIADQWPVDSSLGDVILRAEHQYNDFIKASDRERPTG